MLTGFDIGTKLLVRRYLVDCKIRLLDGFLELSFYSNAGISYGMFRENKFVTHVLPLILIGVLIIVCMKLIPKEEIKQFIRCRIDRIALVMFAAGGLGNYIERLIMGEVTDFISVKNFPTFNIADIFLTFGGYIILIRYGYRCLMKRRKGINT